MIEHRDLEYWRSLIFEYDKQVSDNINSSKNRVNLSETLLNGLRDFVESIACYIRELTNPKQFENRYDEINTSINFCKQKSKLNFISKFHDNLNSSIGHEKFYGEYAERLFLKYVRDLINLKEYMRNNYSLDILSSLTMFPFDLDNSFKEYYQKIVKTLSTNDLMKNNTSMDSYYIKKKKMIYINNVVFYEYILCNAMDKNSRFDRFIAFSLLNIPSNYAIQANLLTKKVSFLKKEVDYEIITYFKIAIRPCEFEKMFSIIGQKARFTKTIEYRKLMNFLQDKAENISNIIKYDDETFENFKRKVFNRKIESNLYKFILNCRHYIQSEKVGSKVLIYLLFKMNNSIISKQLPQNSNDYLSTINLSKGTYSFEKAPFTSGLINHNPQFKDLIKIFDFKDYEHEILARNIAYQSIEKACIYINKNGFTSDNCNDVIRKYNSQFVKASLNGRKIMTFGNYLYLNENELITKEVIKKFLQYSKTVNYPKYKEYIQSQILNLNMKFEDPDKKEALIRLFEKGSIFTIYGPAGSGKSYFAKYVLKTIGNITKTCIASTNAAVENMIRKFEDNSANYMTIKKYLDQYSNESNIDLLIIDECSTVSTLDIYKILTKTSPKLILLLGDVFQIKPIAFGNWFSLLEYFLKENCQLNLNNQFRSTSETLLSFWKEVRNIGPNIKTKLISNKISHILDESIFDKKYEDEIILCLNYDGIYGVNNINKLLQKNNSNKELKWKQYIFKVNDKIIFNENNRFKDVFYNNLKGIIYDIQDSSINIKFTIRVEKVLSPLVCQSNNVDVIEITDNYSIVSFIVKKYGKDYYDNDTDNDTLMPFQIAYALSIHKAQGLEYDSVKIVISNEVEENISHNIFYTAITRAKKDLTIYWTPETEDKIIESFSIQNCERDVKILKSKYPELRKK